MACVTPPAKKTTIPSMPNTDAITTAAGNKVLLRYLNAGLQHHSMGLLGLHETILATNAATDKGLKSRFPTDTATGALALALGTVQQSVQNLLTGRARSVRDHRAADDSIDTTSEGGHTTLPVVAAAVASTSSVVQPPATLTGDHAPWRWRRGPAR